MGGKISYCRIIFLKMFSDYTFERIYGRSTKVKLIEGWFKNDVTKNFDLIPDFNAYLFQRKK